MSLFYVIVVLCLSGRRCLFVIRYLYVRGTCRAVPTVSRGSTGSSTGSLLSMIGVDLRGACILIYITIIPIVPFWLRSKNSSWWWCSSHTEKFAQSCADLISAWGIGRVRIVWHFLIMPVLIWKKFLCTLNIASQAYKDARKFMALISVGDWSLFVCFNIWFIKAFGVFPQNKGWLQYNFEQGHRFWNTMSCGKGVDPHHAKINPINHERFWYLYQWHNRPSPAITLLNKSNDTFDWPDVFSSTLCSNLDCRHIFHDLINVLIHQNSLDRKTTFNIKFDYLC